MLTLWFSDFLLRTFLLVALLISATDILLAQQNSIKTEANKPELNQFARLRSTQWTKEKEKADSIANKLNIPIYYIEESGRVISLQRLGNNNQPVYYATDNISVATTIAADLVWSENNAYPELNGKGVEINLWDGGTVLSTHQEFQSQDGSRVTMRDLELEVSNHSTHISGTMIASGVKPAAKGMAGNALIKGWDLNNDIAEMASAAADGISISNHSYGPLCGWYYNAQTESWYWYGDPDISATEDYKFGFYNEVSADLDYIAKNAPYYLIVKSAGNDRNDGPATPVSHYVWEDNWVLVSAERDADGGSDGFDCLSPAAVAKNILTIGAVDDARIMTSFSAYGPTDDGRIKPDLVSDGADVYSSISSTNSSYSTYSGTSMSTASATGAIALLLQLQDILQPGVNLLSSTIKDILIHSAGDLGNPGPDFSFGWGIINIKAAADILYNNSNNQGKTIYEKILNNGETITIPVKTSSDSPFFKATLCWTDPAGQASNPALNQRTSKLVNDLNLLVENTTTGQSFLPWVLNVENPAATATKGANHTDNVEQVYFVNPGDADLNVKISHSGTLSGGSQAFSLIITEIETKSEIYPPQNLKYSIGESNINISWDSPSIGNPNKYKIYRDGTLLAESNSTSYSDASVIFDNEYTYYVTAVYIIDEEETESLGTNEIKVYPRYLRSLPYFVDFENSPDELQIENNISGWRWGDSEELNSYYLNFSSNNTKFIATDSYSAGEAIHVSDIAATAPLLLENYLNITLSFDYLFMTGTYDAIDELHLVYKLQEETEWHEWLEMESSYKWVHKTFELPPEICKNGTQLGFYYDDLYQWGMGAGLDNIYISGEEEPREIDLAISSLNTPVSACSLCDDEKISISIQNVGIQPALPGDSIKIQMNCTANESVEEILVLSESVPSGDFFTYEMKTHLDLSLEQIYTFEFQINCPLDNNLINNSFDKSIEVFGYPQPEILSTDNTFCENQDAVLIQAIPEGGVLSGTGVSGLYFDPAVAGTGTHTLTYTLTDDNNCAGEVEFQVVVDSVVQPLILNDNLSFCENQDEVLIQAIPEGGVLAGTGVSGMYFDPSVSGIGTHTLTYTLTDDNNCYGETEFQIFVDSVIHPVILNENLSFCENQDAVLIEAVPEGGVLSGTGVSGMYFDPAVAGIGTHSLTYAFPDENNCYGETEFQVVVDAIIHPEILNENLSFCENQVAVLIEAIPEGGILAGTGVSGMYFDPAVAGTGTHTLTYSFIDENNCAGEVEFQVVVDSVVHPLILNDNLSFCEDQEAVLIEASPTGGVLSGTGVSGMYFDPALAGPGIHTITYNLTSDFDCSANPAEEQIIVYQNTVADLGPDLNIGIEDSITLEIEDITCSVVWCDGSTEDKYTIIASELGVGVHPIWVTLSNEASCNSSDTMMLTIDKLDNMNVLDSNTDILLYPNPTRIGFTLILRQGETINELSILGTNGVIYSHTSMPRDPYFDVSFLSSGVYFLMIKTNLGNTYLRLLKL